MRFINSEEEDFFTTEKYAEFICDFEDKWLQYATAADRTKAFFGDLKNAKLLFDNWSNGIDIYAHWKGR